MAVASKRKKKASSRGISLEKYEEFCHLAAAGCSIVEISKRTGISHVTVGKYHRFGDPARGWPPVRERIANVTAAAITKVDARAAERIVKARLSMLEVAELGEELAAQAIRQKLDQPELTLAETMASVGGFVKAVHGVKAALTGKPGEIIGVQGGAEDPTAGLADTEVMELMRASLAACERYGYGMTAEEWEARRGAVEDCATTASVH